MTDGPVGEDLGVSDFGISFRGGASAAARHLGPDVRFRLADEIRRITSAMVGLPIADEEIEAATASLGEVATRLETAAGSGRRLRAHPDPVGHPQDFFPSSPVIGFANPVAPPVVVEAVEGELRGTAFFDYQYEGPPTCVHGGVIAMVFDELLGAANIMAGTPAMTGTLTIKYRKPTPLRTPLRLEARCLGKDGRKVRTYGAIYNGDVLTAEAEGIFVELVPQRFLAIVSESAEGSDAVEQVRADARRLGFADREPS